jgi:hypothetical protein
MSEIFICYSRDDEAEARELADTISAAGYSVWFDLLLEPGVDWASAIERKLDQTACVVALWSASSVKSPWVLYESVDALKKNRLVSVVLAKNIRPPRPVDQIQAARFDEPEKIIEWIARVAGEPPSRRPAPPPIPRNKGFAFISYVAEDIEPQRRLAGFLAERGYGFWEYGSSKRQYDAHLFAEIEDRIRESALALIIVSDHWKQSKWALREFYFCEEIRKPYFLISFGPMDATLAISGIPRIDVSNAAVGFARLADELEQAGL